MTSDPSSASSSWLSARQVVGLLSGRWVVPIIEELRGGPRRYRDLFDSLDGVSHKVLTETLHRLERDGLLSRALGTDRLRATTVYQLTDLVRSLAAPLSALTGWADKHWLSVETAQQSWDLRPTNSSAERRTGGGNST